MKNLFLTVVLNSLVLGSVWAQRATEKSEATLYFDTNQFRLTALHQKQLDSLFPYDMGIGLKHEFHVTGYTDETGPLAYNQWLSTQRATSVADYLRQKGIEEFELVYKGGGICSFFDPNAKQRSVAIEHRRIRGCGLMEETMDTIAFEEPYFKNIYAYFTSEYMIRDRVFAIDIHEKLIKTAGMYLFEPNEDFFKTVNANTMVRFCFPLAKGKKFDPDMKVWRLVLNAKGEKRWEETAVPVHYNPQTNCYETYMNCFYLRGQRGINIDKSNRELEIEISLYKNVDTKEVELTDADFSAVDEKRNLTVYQFVG
ncbi:MAG: OmpA family protein, partial [Flavobacterium sp.]